jgi:hypothetical protein
LSGPGHINPRHSSALSSMEWPPQAREPGDRFPPGHDPLGCFPLELRVEDTSAPSPLRAPST